MPIILFKWVIILSGLAMLCAVAYYMVGCVYQSIAREIQVMLEADREAHERRQQQEEGDLSGGVRVAVADYEP